MSTQLDRFLTVFQAEVLGIIFCVMELLKLNIAHEQIYICSDSQAAIAALNNPLKRSENVHECHQYLEILGQLNNVAILWVPGHSNITGNEKADELARLWSQEQFIGSEYPYISISFGSLRYHMKMWGNLTHLQY